MSISKTPWPVFLPQELHDSLHREEACADSESAHGLDVTRAEVLAGLRSKQKRFETNIRKHLDDLDLSLCRLERARERLVRCRTQISGHEKIIASHSKNLEKARNSGDKKKRKIIEKTMKKETDLYQKMMRKAAAHSARIDRELDAVQTTFKAFREAGGLIRNEELQLKSAS